MTKQDYRHPHVIPDWLNQSQYQTTTYLEDRWSSHHKHGMIFPQGWREISKSPKTHLVELLVTCDSELNAMTWKTLYWRRSWSITQQYLELKSMWTKMGNILCKVNKILITFGHQMTYFKQICCILGETKTFPHSNQSWISHYNAKRRQIFKWAGNENKDKLQLGQHIGFIDNNAGPWKGAGGYTLTHFSEPVRPTLSSMLADMICYHFIAIFVITCQTNILNENKNHCVQDINMQGWQIFCQNKPKRGSDKK